MQLDEDVCDDIAVIRRIQTISRPAEASLPAAKKKGLLEQLLVKKREQTMGKNMRLTNVNDGADNIFLNSFM